MTEIVNLRQARKRKLRAEKETRAAENRAKFGCPKEEKARKAALSELAERHLDRLKLTPET